MSVETQTLDKPHTVFAIGNGESRKGFDLPWLRHWGLTVGCNALYRDFSPDWLVAVDHAMIKEIQTNWKGELWWFNRSNRDQGTKRGTMDKWPKTDRGLRSLPHKGAASGPTSIDLIVQRYPDLKELFLIGHDFYGIDGRVNNVYRDTPNYRGSASAPVGYIHWINQIIKFIRPRPDLRVYRVGPKDIIPKILNDEENVRFIDWQEMYMMLQNNTPRMYRETSVI